MSPEISRRLKTLSDFFERALVLAVDRWHPVAKISDLTNRPDLIESAIALNGAPSTAEFVLQYGPIHFDTAKREFCSLNRPNLSPLKILAPLFEKPLKYQEVATRYILKHSRDPSIDSTDFHLLDMNSIKSITKAWREFERNMNACYASLNMPSSMILKPTDATPNGLLNLVSQEVFLALRSDFVSRLFHSLLTNQRILKDIARIPSKQHQGKTMFHALINGRVHSLEFFEPNVVAMLDSLYVNSSQSSSKFGLLNFAIFVKNILTVGITATPEFAIKNGIRDMLSAFVLGKQPQNPWHTISGAQQYFKQSDIVKDWMLQGGSFGSFYDHAVETSQSGNNRFAFSVTEGQSQIKKLLIQFWRIYTAPFRALEAGSRITQYSRVLSAGGSKRQALMQSRQISTDFSDRGASQNWWNYCRTVPFLNAALQGMNQLRKVYFTVNGTGGQTKGLLSTSKSSSHTRKSLSRACVLALIPIVALGWNLSDSSRTEQYEAQAAFDKSNYVYFYDVNGIDFRIPVPFELGAIFMKFPELVADRILGVSTVDTDSIQISLFDRIPPTVVASFESTFLLSFIPALIQPAYHVIRNRDFLDRTIEPEYMKNWPIPLRKFSSTPIILQKLSETIPIISPLKLKVFFEGHFGHMARLLFHGTDELFWDNRLHGEKAFPQFWYRATGIRAFVRKGPVSYSRYSIDIYRIKDATAYSMMACRSMPERCEELRHMILAERIAGSFAKVVSSVRREIRQLYETQTLSRESKEKRINKQYLQIHEVSRQGLQQVRSVLN